MEFSCSKRDLGRELLFLISVVCVLKQRRETLVSESKTKAKRHLNVNLVFLFSCGNLWKLFENIFLPDFVQIK